MKKLILLLNLLGIVLSQSCSYEANIDYFGNDLSNYPTFTTSIDACCALCSSTSGCAAWTFLPSTGACWVKYAVGSRRYMSDGRYSGVRQSVLTTVKPTTLPPTYHTVTTVAPVTTAAPVTTTPATTAAPITTIPTTTGTTTPATTAPSTSTTTSTQSTTTKVSGCFIENDINYAGYDLRGVGSVPLASDCCNLCGADPQCQAWSYYVEYQYCYLKTSGNGPKDPYPGMLSGVVKVRA
ncbi:unnamed protein product [Brachionus calyciflorus]|uniref:Apple domain-containing protein n=1 Tax=Brachionus calyciflorus TaxID=104777 RepID=A0A813UW69_9BILA|nr:unnamed protein product [Brachionus calyciflorus]